MNKIVDKQSSVYYQWGNNCDSWVFVDTEGLSVKAEKMPGGTQEKLHFHSDAQQFFYILKGTATFYLDNTTQVVTEHKGILIKPKSKHYIANETSDEIEFLVVSQPTTNNDRTTL